MNNKVVFLTTIFPMSEKFLADFFQSLADQTYVNFDIVVVNDGYRNFNKIKSKYSALTIIEIPYKNTPVKNREYGINFCKVNGYSILVFGDCDDYFSNNRVEKSVELLLNYDIVVNDLSLFNEDGVYENRYFSNRISNNLEIDYDFIKDKNIFGLSNTAINLKIISIVVFPVDVEILDWFFYKKLLSLGISSIFTNETETYYRQHKNNLVGLDSFNGKYPLWWEK
jgi:glycosyltransferase involved in cell wall biosynthesis